MKASLYSRTPDSAIAQRVSSKGLKNIVNNRHEAKLSKNLQAAATRSSQQAIQLQKVSQLQTDGCQENIQKKMLKVIKKLRGTTAASPALTAWYGLVRVNGLCGGWAAMHREAPTVLETVWRALEEWDPADGLDALKTKVDPDLVVTMLINAYRVMNTLEPTVGYGQVPQELANYKKDISENRLKSMKKMSVTVGKNGAGKKLLDTILHDPMVKKTRHSTIHIETHSHHMSVSTESINNKVRIKAIVESEEVGIVRTPDNGEAERVLDGGFYLGQHQEARRDDYYKVSLVIYA